MLLFGFFIKQAVQYDFAYKGKEEIFTAHGVYFFELWGAQGGRGTDNNQFKSDGGKGAYVSGEASFLTKQNLTIKVGGQGQSGNRGPHHGGWPDGGNSGQDSGIMWESQWDGSGAGGGSTSLYLDDIKLRVAGAGAGGVTIMNDCQGGTLGKHFCPANGNSCYEVAETQNGNANGFGGNRNTEITKRHTF